MYDEPFPLWYITLGLVIAGVMLFWATISQYIKYRWDKVVFNRFTRARTALEKVHEREMKELTCQYDFRHNSYEKGILLRIAEGVTDEELKDFEARIYRSKVARDLVVNQKKAEHAKEHRDLELRFGY